MVCEFHDSRDEERIKQNLITLATQEMMRASLDYEIMVNCSVTGEMHRQRGETNQLVSINWYDEIINAQLRDARYFREHFGELARKHNKQYVAIRNSEVVDSDKKLDRLLSRIRSGPNKWKSYFIKKIDRKSPPCSPEVGEMQIFSRNILS